MTHMSWYAIKPTIHTEKARKILGDKASTLTDRQIEVMLRSLYALSERVIQSLIEYDDRQTT
jgi:hypothetical protein